MKVSRVWLQKHFKDPLPDAAALAEALTFHAFEIEEHNDDMLDVKVLPDRAAYALSHRGIAYELSAILGIPMSYDPLAKPLPVPGPTDEVVLTIDTPKADRHMGALVRGVKVGSSPLWLKEALEAVGQRSINNVVDATNCVTLAMGQPLHAFDADKIAWKDGKLHIGIREAVEGESVPVLSGETYQLPEGTLVICEGQNGKPLDIAGIKGGMASAITEETKDLFVSVAHFDAASVRRAARALSLWTDASLRFQNNPSAELARYGMGQILALIKEVAGGDVVGMNDLYPNKEPEPEAVRTSLLAINARLGSDFSDTEVRDVCARLGLAVEANDGKYLVTPPFVRRDIAIPEDIAEEVGRILGYERITGKVLSSSGVPDQVRCRGIERIKDFLVERGFTEVSTQSFDKEGDIQLANPLQDERPWLRASLRGNMRDALARALHIAPRVFGPVPDVRLFELGSVFQMSGEHFSLSLGYAPTAGKKRPVLEETIDALVSELGLARPSDSTDGVAEIDLSATDLENLGEGYTPAPARYTGYRPFSIYPFALRDIAVWTPEGTKESEVCNIILKEAGDLLARIDLFDQFSKDGRTSYAFRLVFESADHTLDQVELDAMMKRITDALGAVDGYTVR